MKPLLSVEALSRMYGPGCDHCVEETGPETATNVCSRCGSVLACHDVGFDLYPDEALGIVGESGSGKSTVVRLLHLEDEPTTGRMSLRMNGQGERVRQALRAQRADFSLGSGSAGESENLEDDNIFDLSPYLKRKIQNFTMGIVYQHPNLGLRMSISSGGNVAEKLLMSGWRNVGEMRQRAAELLERTEAPVSRMDEPPRNFSGGMQQRVQIAKALAIKPMLLLLDEVTTGLDVSVQARVLDLVRQLRREMKVAMVVVSHDLGVIRMLTSRTMVMKNGRIVESGLTDQILDDPQHPYTQLLVGSIL